MLQRGILRKPAECYYNHSMSLVQMVVAAPRWHNNYLGVTTIRLYGATIAPNVTHCYSDATHTTTLLNVTRLHSCVFMTACS